MNYELSKVDAMTSDIIFNYVLEPVYQKGIKDNLNDSDLRAELNEEASKYLDMVGEDRYVFEDLVNDFLDRL